MLFWVRVCPPAVVELPKAVLVVSIEVATLDELDIPAKVFEIVVG
jgi:hypothetical protein